MALNARKELILKAMIEAYIETGEPVGSRTLSKLPSIALSPATIRNEMADLEEMGYISQPHTSAGRIPSQAGYRYYVDYLMENHFFQEDQIEAFNRYLHTHTNSHEETMETVVKLVSEMTNYAAILLLPEEGEDEGVLSKLAFIPLSRHRALMVIVTDKEKSYNRFINLPNLDETTLKRVEGSFNRVFRGLAPKNWHKGLFRILLLELSDMPLFTRYLVEELKQLLDNNLRRRYYVEGISNLLEFSEFQELDKAKALLSLLEKPENLERIVAGEEVGIDIKIAQENTDPLLHECTLMVGRYESGRKSGYLGIIGPKRMNYSATYTLLSLLMSGFHRAFASENTLVVSGRRRGEKW